MAGKESFTKKVKLKGKLKKDLPRKIQAKISEQINSKLTGRLGTKLKETAQGATRSAQATAQIAAEVAKTGLDQVLLGLEHRGISLKESQDLAQKMGRKVLERAEAIRAQIAANPLSPAWLREVSLKPPGAQSSDEQSGETQVDETVTADAASSLTETTVSAAAEGVSEPAHDRLKCDSEASPDFEESSEAEKGAKKARRAPTTGARRSSGSISRLSKS